MEANTVTVRRARYARRLYSTAPDPAKESLDVEAPKLSACSYSMTGVGDWKPPAAPQRVSLEGRYCRLEPLDPLVHAKHLFDASMAPGVEGRFRYLMENPQDRSGFERWVARAATTDDPLFFAVINAESGRCEGRQSYMRITPEHGVIEIGAILWGPAIARTRVSTEALFLAAQHAFDTLGYRRFEWKCNSENEPSRRAALRFGFSYEGLFRQHMVVKGQNRDTAWFAMIDRDWPAIRSAFQRWLAPANFDDVGQQKVRLEALRNTSAVP